MSKELKFIPTPNPLTDKEFLDDFPDFKNRLNVKAFVHEQAKEGNPNFSKNKTLPPKFLFGTSKFVPPKSYPKVDNFCYDFREALSLILEEDKQLPKKFKDNLSRMERNAILQLQNNKSIIIKPSDKNLGLVIMDLAWYEEECFNQLLGDTKTYLELSKTEVDKFCLKAKILIKHIVEKFRQDLSNKEVEFLFSKLDNFEIPNFYIIPKLHKDPIVGKPIVAGYNWITAPISKFVAHFLQVTYKHFDTILKDSLSLIQTLETTVFPGNIALYTIDIKSLYTNIPVDHAIKVIKSFLKLYPIENGDFIMECLEFVLKNNIMKFKDQFFHQIFGIAMGQLTQSHTKHMTCSTTA